jgi:histidinol-phosphate aminotransferase
LSTRTLSKAYAIAGLRIGYGLAGSPEVANGLVRVKLNFNLSSLAVVAAEAALADEAYAQDCIARTLAERERVSSLIEKMGYRTLPSRANFVSFDYGPTAASVVLRLAAQGVFLREWRDPGFETFVRITVGLPQENDRALAAVAVASKDHWEIDRARNRTHPASLRIVFAVQ